MKVCKKLLVTVGLGALLCLFLVGCATKTSRSVTFSVDTGDTIKVTYDTTDSDLSLYYEGTDFYIGKKDETPVVTGCFAHEEAWDYYTSAVSEDETATTLSFSDTENDKFIIYSVESEVGTQYIKIMLVPDSNTYIVIVTVEGEDVLMSEAERLTFEKK